MISNRNNNDNYTMKKLKSKINRLREKLNADNISKSEVNSIEKKIKILEKQYSLENKKSFSTSSGAGLLNPSPSEISQPQETRRKVVLDGSNIIWGGAQGMDSVPKRLISAIDFYENLGYEVISIMRRSMFQVITNKRIHGFEVLEHLRSKKKLELADDDDLVVILTALRINAWIVTQDTFSHDKEDNEGNRIPSEREQFSDWSWDDIDSRTRGTEKQRNGKIKSGYHWSFVGSTFEDPTMPQAPIPTGPFNPYMDIQKRAQGIRHEIDELLGDLDDVKIESDEDFKKQKKAITQARNKIESFEKLISNSGNNSEFTEE